MRREQEEAVKVKPLQTSSCEPTDALKTLELLMTHDCPVKVVNEW